MIKGVQPYRPAINSVSVQRLETCNACRVPTPVLRRRLPPRVIVALPQNSRLSRGQGGRRGLPAASWILFAIALSADGIRELNSASLLTACFPRTPPGSTSPSPSGWRSFNSNLVAARPGPGPWARRNRLV